MNSSKMGSILSYRNTNLNEYPYKMSPRIDSLLKNERGVKLDDSDIEKLFLISYSKLHSEFFLNGDGTFPEFYLIFNSKEKLIDVEFFDEADFVPSSFNITKFKEKYIDLLERNVDYIVMEYYSGNEETSPDKFDFCSNIFSISEVDLEILNSQKVKSQILSSLKNFDSKKDKFFDELKDFISFAFN